MSKTLIAVLVVLGGGFFAALIALIWGISTFNTASTLRNQYEMKVKANEAVFDNTWKKINQSVQVSDEYKNALKEVIVGNANARSPKLSNGINMILVMLMMEKTRKNG